MDPTQKKKFVALLLALIDMIVSLIIIIDYFNTLGAACTASLKGRQPRADQHRSRGGDSRRRCSSVKLSIIVNDIISKRFERKAAFT